MEMFAYLRALLAHPADRHHRSVRSDACRGAAARRQQRRQRPPRGRRCTTTHAAPLQRIHPLQAAELAVPASDSEQAEPRLWPRPAAAAVAAAAAAASTAVALAGGRAPARRDVELRADPGERVLQPVTLDRKAVRRQST